jgi:hypothetical protein
MAKLLITGTDLHIAKIARLLRGFRVSVEKIDGDIVEESPAKELVEDVVDAPLLDIETKDIEETDSKPVVETPVTEEAPVEKVEIPKEEVKEELVEVKLKTKTKAK